jgi:tetratricopeptide (TPR) repeat protein
MARAEALAFLGQREEQGLALAEAWHVAEGDEQRARVRIAQATWLARTARMADAIDAGREAVAAGDRVGRPALRAMARVRLAVALIYSGALEEAEAVVDEAEELCSDVNVHVRAFVAEARGHHAAALGDLALRERAFADASELFRTAGDVRRAAANESNLADTYNRLGAYAEAEAALRGAVEGCRRVGNRLGEAYALLNLAYALGMKGATKEALGTLDHLVTLPLMSQDSRLELTARLYRSRILLPLAKNGERIGLVAEGAEKLARDANKGGATALEVAALAVASRARLEMGDREGALGHAETAMQLRDELGSVEEDEAEIFLALADALAAEGKYAEAHDAVLRGQSRLRYIAARIADRKWRDRFLNQVAAHRELMHRT